MKRLIAIVSLATALCLPCALKAQVAIGEDAMLFASADNQVFLSLTLPADEDTPLFADAKGQTPPPPPFQGGEDKDRMAPPPPQQQGQVGQGPDGQGQHQGMKGGMRESLDSKKAMLDPAKFAELQKLREQEAAIVKDFFAKEKADREEFKKLVDEYKASPTDELKGKIREKIASRVDAQFKAKETRLAEMSKRLEDAKKDKDATVDKVLDRVLSAKEQPKGGPCPMLKGPGPMKDGCCPMMKGFGQKPEGRPVPPCDNN